MFNRFNCCVHRRHHGSGLWNWSSGGPALLPPLPRGPNSKDSWLSNLALSHLSAGFCPPSKSRALGPPAAGESVSFQETQERHQRRMTAGRRGATGDEHPRGFPSGFSLLFAKLIILRHAARHGECGEDKQNFNLLRFGPHNAIN